MEVLNEKPPAWIMEGCLSQFRVNVDNTFWTYGDVIYNPGGQPLPDHIVAHEEAHSVQQMEYYEQDENGKILDEGKDGWWRRYLSDPRFRMEQEAEAYGAQYAHVCDRVKNRDARARFLFDIAGHFSGPLYQIALTRPQARAMIEVLAGKKDLAAYQ